MPSLFVRPTARAFMPRIGFDATTVARAFGIGSRLAASITVSITFSPLSQTSEMSISSSHSSKDFCAGACPGARASTVYSPGVTSLQT